MFYVTLACAVFRLVCDRNKTIFYYFCNWVKLCLCTSAATNGPIVSLQDGTGLDTEHRWNFTNSGKPEGWKENLSQCRFVH
jgi:hypothetical protein